MLKVIITGSNGMLGSVLCKVLRKHFTVYAFHRDSDCHYEHDFSYSIELRDKDKLDNIVEKIKPDIIIHCAGWINIEQCEVDTEKAYENNVIATYNLVTSCPKQAKFIYISSDQVYGITANRTEHNKCLNPLNIYGETKYISELIVNSLCENHMIIRTNIIGINPHIARTSFVDWLYDSFFNNKPITLFDDYHFSPIYTSKLSTILEKLISIDFCGYLNVGTHESCSKYEFGFLFAEICNFNKNLILEGSLKDSEIGNKRANDLSLNINKLLSYEIKTPSIKDSINQYKIDKLNY
jgi:dTDP-4-dehydrorhamnose reductase